jgi:hypothetical protein
MTDEYDPQAQMQAIDKQVGAWFDAFVSSSQYQRLSESRPYIGSALLKLFAPLRFNHQVSVKNSEITFM